jgi:hypothetical protein
MGNPPAGTAANPVRGVSTQEGVPHTSLKMSVTDIFSALHDAYPHERFMQLSIRLTRLIDIYDMAESQQARDEITGQMFDTIREMRGYV